MSFFVQTAIVIILAALAQGWKGRTGLFWFIGLSIWFLAVNAVVAVAMATDARYAHLPPAVAAAAVDRDGMAPIFAGAFASIIALFAVATIPSKKR